MYLETALARAERREKIGGYVVIVSGMLTILLMFVGGSKVAGDFDPWSNMATPLSIILGLLFVISNICFWISLASYYSRWKPGVRASRDEVRDALLADLQQQLAELRQGKAAEN